jgi:hypothetical protein
VALQYFKETDLELSEEMKGPATLVCTHDQQQPDSTLHIPGVHHMKAVLGSKSHD